MDAFWDAILSAGSDVSDASDASYMLQQNFRGGYRPMGNEKTLCNGFVASLASLTSLGADPYDTSERHEIQQEGNEISDLPDKPALTLAEQAALVLDRCNGGIGLLVEDLRTVARNFALADYIAAGNAAPQPILAQTTPMTPDRGFDDVPGFEGMPDLTPSEHGAILHRLMNPPQESPAPATVTCGSCAEFEPGNTPLGIGLCSRTANGLPPVASRGYGACFPIAPRSCPDYKES